MVFFQAMLLAGYAYAHWSVRALVIRVQPWVHVGLLGVADCCRPFSIRGAAESTTQTHHPAIWALLTLTRALGVPVFVLASTAPLLQKLFASTVHPKAGDPYFLYAASNVGSFGALFAYPLLIEPLLPIPTQTRWWACGYWILTIGMAACARLRTSYDALLTEVGIDEKQSALSWSERLKWIGLSFVPSTLMLGVTSYITTDVASIPLLWVVPLALYLLTFVIAFGQPSPGLQMVSARALPILALAVVFPLLVQATEPVLILVVLHLVFFFTAALQCHLQLARLRPAAKQLTSFYLYLSLGGALGGIFNALVAPVAFRSVAEYPLAIVIAIVVAYPKQPAERRRSPLLEGVGVVGLMATGSAFIARSGSINILAGNVIAGILLIGAFLFLRRPVTYALGLATLLGCTTAFRQAHSGLLERDRNFFGVLRVTNDADKPLRKLYHGTTIHGVQFTSPDRACEPLSYYHSEGPVGEIARLFESLPLPRRVALVGLGAGAMLTYSKPEESWTIYEIDPAVIRIARDTNLFTYLSQCARAPFRIELGDARLRLATAADSAYGLIFLDAFSSDVIPTHLLTIEALRLYRRTLAPGGILAFHLSSRHFELEPLVARLGNALGFRCFASTRGDLSPKAIAEGGLESNWVILVPDVVVPAVLSQATWQRIIPGEKAPFWTDDFSSLLGVLKLD